MFSSCSLPKCPVCPIIYNSMCAILSQIKAGIQNWTHASENWKGAGPGYGPGKVFSILRSEHFILLEDVGACFLCNMIFAGMAQKILSSHKGVSGSTPAWLH